MALSTAVLPVHSGPSRRSRAARQCWPCSPGCSAGEWSLGEWAGEDGGWCGRDGRVCPCRQDRDGGLHTRKQPHGAQRERSKGTALPVMGAGSQGLPLRTQLRRRKRTQTRFSLPSLASIDTASLPTLAHSAGYCCWLLPPRPALTQLHADSDHSDRSLSVLDCKGA